MHGSRERERMSLCARVSFGFPFILRGVLSIGAETHQGCVLRYCCGRWGISFGGNEVGRGPEEFRVFRRVSGGHVLTCSLGQRGRYFSLRVYPVDSIR